MRFLLTFILICSVTAQAQIHGGFPWYRPTPKGNNFRLRNSNIIVSAGANQSVTNQTFTLSGGATNLSFPTHPLSYNWSLKSPFEFVQIVTATSSNTTVIVTNNVSYVFELTAQDTPYFNSAFTTVNVSTPNPVTNQPPSITAIADQIVLENTPTNVAWVASDDTTPPGSLTYIVSSSNPNLVPNGNLVLGGSGANRTLMLTPLTHSNGVATISVTPIDAQLLPGVTRQFAFNVLATNDPPTISTPPPQSTLQNTPKTVSFTVGDIETPPGNLVCSASSSDLSKVLNSQIVQGGSGANRTVTITPVTNAFGTVTITIRASDGLIVTSTSFVLTITHVNQAPTLAAIPDSTTLQDTPLTLALDAQDIDSTLTTASFSCTSSSNPALIGTGNVSFGGSVGSFTLVATPLAGQTGSSTLTIQVSDGSLTASRSFLLTVVSSQFVIPSARSADWTQAGMTALGGIPVVSSQFCNIKLSIPGSSLTAKGDGVTDDTAAINAANANCPSNQFVLFPSGTYLKTGLTTMKSGVVFRGAGMGKSRILGGTFDFTASGIDSYKDVNLVDAILAKGSSNMIVQTTGLGTSTTPGLTIGVGSVIVIGVTNDNNLVNPVGFEGSSANYFSSFPNKNLGQMAEVTAVSPSGGNQSITFWPPAVWNYSNSLGVVVRSFAGVCRRAGIEDMTLEPPAPQTQDNMVLLNGAAQCWLKNVRIPLSYSQAVFLRKALRCEMRGCYLEYTKHSASNGGYGFEAILLPSWNLIEDNIIEGLRVSIGIEGGSGNVGAFNYIPWNTNNVDVLQKQIMFHASCPAFNLFEGNKSTSSGGDNTFGSSIFNTYFRNYVTGINPKGATAVPTTQYNWAARVDAHCVGYNFVGNVFGTPGMTGVYESSSAIGGGTRAFGTKYIFTLGYPDDGATTTAPDSGFPYDPNVRNTLLRMVNFDYVNNATVSNVNLTASLHLTAKPLWFGSLAWPPIGPDVVGKTNTIPAEERYLAMVGPSFSVTDKTGAVSTPVVWTLSASAPDNEFFAVVATSSNPGLIPSGSIVATGIGTNRTVTMTPVSGQSGSSTVTVTLDDGRFSAVHAFTYMVQSGNAPPTITGFSNQSIAENSATAALAFTVADADTPVASLTNGKITSNPTLTPPSGIIFGGGTGANRTVQITPAAGQTGSATITVTVSDGTSTVGTGFVLTVTGTGNTWYAKPPKTPSDPSLYSGGNFVSQGSGTASDPWDLFTACNSSLVQPGDHIELYGAGSSFSDNGVYSNVFQFHRSGTDDAHPVIYEPFNNQKVILDGFDHHICQGEKQGPDQPDATVAVMMCHYVWLKGLELKATPTTRLSTNQDTSIDLSFPPDMVFPGLFNAGENPSTDGVGCRLIECYLHDGQAGVSIFDNANNVELYGCLIANIGFDEFDRGHGPNAYMRSQTPGNRVLDCVSSSSFSQNWQVFGKAGGVVVRNLDFEGNMCWNGGELAAGQALPFYNNHGQFTTGLGMYTLSDVVFDSLIQSNGFYYPVSSDSPSFNLGGSLDGGNGDTRCTNLFNTIVSRVKFDKNPGPNVFQSNSVYYSNLQNFTISDFPNNFYTTTRPAQSVTIHRRTDKYTPRRGHVYFWRWANETQVLVDPSQLGYAIGGPIKIYSFTDVRRGHALFSGTWIGGTIPINISSITVAPLIGSNAGRQPTSPQADLVCLVASENEPF